MIPKSITATDVRAAIAFIDQNGVPKSRRSTRYHLVLNGRRYPPKYVVSIAAKQVTGMELSSHVFNGGHETNAFLESRGFHIESKQATCPITPSGDNSGRHGRLNRRG
jgi:hypothetical protein